MTVLGGEHIATSSPVAYDILPQLLSHSASRRSERLLNAYRAGAGFDHLIAKRGRNGYNRGAAAHARTRHLSNASAGCTRPLEVGVAESFEQLAAADELIRKRYAWRGYKVDSSEGDELPDTHNDPAHNITFLAMEQASVVGTITLRLDGPDGLRADASHGDVIQYAREDGRRLGELTRLALAEHVDSRQVLSSLFGLVYSVGRWVHKVTDIFVEVNPRHVAFYVRALGFAIVGDVKFCERVRAPSILLYADADSLEERLGLATMSWPSQLESARGSSA